MVAKKNTAVRKPWTKEDVRELKAHSKAKTPVEKLTKAEAEKELARLAVES